MAGNTVSVSVRGWENMREAIESVNEEIIDQAVKNAVQKVMDRMRGKPDYIAGSDIKAGSPVYIRDGKAYDKPG